jgi:hypothetical protein
MAFKSNLLYAAIALAGITGKRLHLKSGQLVTSARSEPGTSMIKSSDHFTAIFIKKY